MRDEDSKIQIARVEERVHTLYRLAERMHDTVITDMEKREQEMRRLENRVAKLEIIPQNIRFGRAAIVEVGRFLLYVVTVVGGLFVIARFGG